MAANPDRILKQRDVTVMAALDTIDHLTTRVESLLAHGRRITTVTRLTYVDAPPQVRTGLTLDRIEKRDGMSRDAGMGVSVYLKPGALSGFSFSAYPTEADTEAQVRARYYAEKDTPMGLLNLTEIRVKGGLPGNGPTPDDQMVIRHWNSSGVCRETVVAFDCGPDRQQIREDLAKYLWVTDGGDPQMWDKLADAAWSLDGYNRRTGHTLKLEDGDHREKFLAAADQILAVITDKDRP